MYASQEWPVQRSDSADVPKLLDPALLRAARKIHRAYQEVHPEDSKRPIGVAIHRVTHRGHLIFAGKPVLLPTECFVPFEEMESELY